MAKARQTIRVRIKKSQVGNAKSGLKPCNTCGGTGIVKKK